mgnify:CR=1 FL=1
MKWGCKKCGSCCVILYKYVYGIDCRHYDNIKKQCKIYNSRPNICRVDPCKVEDVKLIEACKRLQKLNKEV